MELFQYIFLLDIHNSIIYIMSPIQILIFLSTIKPNNKNLRKEGKGHSKVIFDSVLLALTVLFAKKLNL
jgi:hypothetical protein